MRIGVPKEIKNHEDRVAMTPANAFNLVQAGHEVFIESSAGVGSSYEDSEYEEVGAKIVSSAKEAWDVDMVVKVKEPLESEYQYLREDLIVMTYLHLADNEPLVDALIENKTTGVAYETMELNGKLPLLNPMSEVAGRTAIQVGAHYLEKTNGGKGKLLGGVPGTQAGKVVIIGGGNVGYNAARMAVGLGANVTILDLNPARLGELDDLFQGRVNTLMSNAYNIANEVKDADVVIGSVLIPGRKAPILVTEDMVKTMEEGSVLIDVAIDQGGNFETSDHATNHDDPVYTKHGIVHYTVANIPGAVPKTATEALTNATMTYVQQIANLGIEEAAKANHTVFTGVNTYKGELTSADVAETSKHDYKELKF
ncbi:MULTISPECIES: alanine dehydrogenase [Aerococcus]|uniref:Alanine dehydrogenase n=2 Tax=Aerococcus TaxID=1375 RepID=A0A178HFD8_9LACT|nr:MULTISPECIES: alanine dehydrogenase [Aerococcus]MDL5184774.1 alanine dehydrogenase [Aerococcus mictus]KAA9218678.1 alanine dehydrogenase [Aerococcus loyolae]KAA9265019.1 alanine dehydrogenase [Aerococcus loyolae]MBU5609948.1 alanine dehydrogenase [Aerococcus urinae]MCY3025866.1 alanine dehydrogenase [Aerococcus loyolae]